MPAPLRLASFRRLLADRRGGAAVFLAIALVPLVGAVGLSVDSSAGYLLRTRLAKSLDAAGLAAGRIALDPGAEAVARAYFDANFGMGGDAVVTGFTFAIDDTRHFVTLTARAETSTYFMRIFGRTRMEVMATTEVERQTSGMELALVLDNTGSLWGSKTKLEGTNFDFLQKAAQNLVDVIYGDETEIDHVWISLVPYVATVSIGPSRSGWLAAGDQVSTNPSAFGAVADGGGWKGCVMARAYPWDTDDSPPSLHPFRSFLYPRNRSDNDWPAIDDDYRSSNADRKGPNLGCGTPITPLTASRATIEAGIAAMKPWRRGGTAGNLGLAWGWRTISPRWRGLWGEADLPLDYRTDFMEKVVVILTDGNNAFNNTGSPSDYTAYGRVNAAAPEGLAAASIDAGVAILNTRMGAVCTAMKAEGIRIYSIIFGTDANAATRRLYEDCASSPAMYYWAKSSSEIGGVFTSIGGQLANLRIVR